MRQKPYYPQLIAGLRETLEHLEAASGMSADDPTLLELKTAILRILAEHEVQWERKPHELEIPTMAAD